HWLTPALRQPFGKEPPGNVRASPRWKRDDQLDCAPRPGLRERILNGRGKRQCDCEDEQKNARSGASDRTHDVLLSLQTKRLVACTGTVLEIGFTAALAAPSITDRRASSQWPAAPRDFDAALTLRATALNRFAILVPCGSS